MEDCYDPIIPGEYKLIASCVKSWIDEHNNKLEWNSGILEFGGFLTYEKDTIVFSTRGQNRYIQIAMEYPLNETSVSTMQSQLKWVAFDRIALPGFDIPSNWQIYPQTPNSSFSDGVTFNSYDSTTHTLDITINTSFFCVHGSMIKRRLIPGSAPKGTYFQVRRSIEGHVNILAHLNVSSIINI